MRLFSAMRMDRVSSRHVHSPGSAWSWTSKLLLRAIEAKAKELKLSRIDLETGPKSHAAIHLYETAGYRLCGPFAQYKNDPNSVFMTKDLMP